MPPMADPEFDVDEQYTYAKDLYKLITWAESYARLETRLRNKSEIDNEIHTEEILQRRYQKHMDNPLSLEHMVLKDMKFEIMKLEESMQQLRPKVWDTTELTRLADHEQMSNLNDQWKAKKAEVEQYLKTQFPKMVRIIPKVFDKIADGAKEEVIDDVFKMMRKCINGHITEAQGFNMLANNSEKRDNLPKDFYKPMRL